MRKISFQEDEISPSKVKKKIRFNIAKSFGETAGNTFFFLCF